ncbi:uncharacterized protein TNCV_3532641 [Trichonephila clavipes]|nr:uncharacterized protein TNCV_3532641 [Trichonephila clavipes]
MAPHTITPAVGAVCRCKAKAGLSFLVRGTTPKGGVKGSTRIGRRDLKCPSARRLRMVREDTGAPNKGATCAWMAADEAVGCTTYRPPPRSERYGSCSVLATVDRRVYRRGGSGRPRNTNDREDRAIRRVATSAPTTSLASIQRHLPPSRHPVPSRETIKGDD